MLISFTEMPSDVHGGRIGRRVGESRTTIMAVASAVAMTRDAVPLTRRSYIGVPPSDEYQAKQLVSSSSALTKFSLGGEVFGKELRARDKNVGRARMHSRVLPNRSLLHLQLQFNFQTFNFPPNWR